MMWCLLKFDKTVHYVGGLKSSRPRP